MTTRKSSVFLEILEARIAPATLFVGKAESLIITLDTGEPGLSPGDLVTWDPGAGSSHGGPVEGLLFGTNVFTSISAADAKANPHDANGPDRIRVGSGIFTEQVIVNNASELLGNQAGIDARGRVANETILNHPGGSLFINASNVHIDGFVFEGQRDEIRTGPAVSAAQSQSGFILENSILRNNGTALGWGNGPGAQSIVRHNWFVDNFHGEAGVGNAITSPWGLQNVLLEENRFSGAHGINTVILSKGLTGGAGVVVLGNEFLDGNSLTISGITGFSVAGNRFEGVQTGVPFGPNHTLTLQDGTGQVAGNTFSNLEVTAIQAQGDFTGGLTIENNDFEQDVALYRASGAAVISVGFAKGEIVVADNRVTLLGVQSAQFSTAIGVGVAGTEAFTAHILRNTFDASAVTLNEQSPYRWAAVQLGGSAEAVQTSYVEQNILKGWHVGLVTPELGGNTNVSARGNDFSGNRLAISNLGDNTIDARFNWFGETSAKKVAEKVSGNVNTTGFATTGEDQAPGLPGFQSAAVLDLRKPGVAVYTDPDGDRVVVKAGKGTFTWEQFQLRHGQDGYHLSKLMLDQSFADAKLSIALDARKSTGDGHLAVGYIDARDIDLRSISIKGDLQYTEIGDDDLTTPGLGTLSVYSLGRENFGTDPTVDPVTTWIAGGLGKLTVRDSIYGVNVATGTDPSVGIGQVNIGRNLIGSGAIGSAVITAGYLGSVKIGGSMLAGSAGLSAAIVASAEIGSISIGGDLIGNRLNSSGEIHAGTTIGRISIGGDLYSATISAAGINAPATTSEAMAIRQVLIGGEVTDSRILAGYSFFSLVRSDVQIGTIQVKGGWHSSDVAAGVQSFDDLFGNDNDSIMMTNDPAIVSRIAKIMIGGPVTGSSDSTDHFGFVAEEIGSFQVGKKRLSLTVSETDSILLGGFGDVAVREITRVL